MPSTTERSTADHTARLRVPSFVRLIVLGLLGVAATTRCASTDRAEDSGSTPSAPAPATSNPTSNPMSNEETTAMRIRITAGDDSFAATLDESAAAGDLLAQLPQTVQMRDHQGVEKTGRLTSPLSLEGQPEGADPEVGDLGYYAPGQDLVLYYGDQDYFPGIVVLGRLDGDTASRIAAVDGDLTVRVEPLTD